MTDFNISTWDYDLIYNTIMELLQGCTVPEATNYDPKVTLDDGSCSYGISGQLKDSGGNNIKDAAILLTYDLPDFNGRIMSRSNMPTTKIDFLLPTETNVLLFIEDMCGDTINILVDEILNAGYYSIAWDAAGVLEGQYFARLVTPEYSQTQILFLALLYYSDLEMIKGELIQTLPDTAYTHNYHAMTDIDGNFSIPLACLSFGLEQTATDEFGNPVDNWTIPYRAKLWIVHEGDSMFVTDSYDIDSETGLNVAIQLHSQSGCTDEVACNYDDWATIDNGSCEYMAEGVCDCAGSLDTCTICPVINSNNYGDCGDSLGYAFTGQSCEYITGCGVGNDVELFFDDIDECIVINKDCQNCKTLDHASYGACEITLGWGWTGEACELIYGCGVSDDEPWFYEEEEICNGRCSYGYLKNETMELPQNYLFSSYPNPFNPSVTISFSIPEFGLATIIAYDITGRELAILANEVLNIGNYSINWNASSYPSGLYLIRMDSGEFTQTQKVMLVK